HRLSYRPDLVLSRMGVKCVAKPCGVSWISPELVLRSPKQDCAEYPNEICAFDPELVLRDVPGKSAQWRRESQRFRWPVLLSPLPYPSGGEVIRTAFPPVPLRLYTAGRLTFRVSASSLTRSDSRIGTKPAAANTTGSLSDIGHGDSSSPHLK